MTPKKVYDKSKYPAAPDAKYSVYRQTGNIILPEEKYEEFLADYADMWAYWQNEIKPFGIRPLWENGAPGYNPAFKQPQPGIGVKFHEDGPARGMILVCAGGAFLWKADYEGPVVANYFYDLGFNVAVLDYRLQPYSQEISRMDAKRAIRYLRYHAAEFNTLPDHIAIMGFSAGGMLTCATATIYDNGDPDAADPIDRLSSRPDAAIPCYGSRSLAAWPGGGLSYDRERQKMLAARSPDCHVTPDCPPFSSGSAAAWTTPATP